MASKLIALRNAFPRLDLVQFVADHPRVLLMSLEAIGGNSAQVGSGAVVHCPCRNTPAQPMTGWGV